MSVQVFFCEFCHRYRWCCWYRWQTFQWHQWSTFSCEYLCEFSKKIETALFVLRGLGETQFMTETWSQKSRVTVPLEYNFCPLVPVFLPIMEIFQVEISFSSRYSQLAELSCIESGIDIIRVSFLFYVSCLLFWKNTGWGIIFFFVQTMYSIIIVIIIIIILWDLHI